MRKNILAGLLMLIIAGCGETIYSGRITEKKFIPEHWEKQTSYEYDMMEGEYNWVEKDVFVEDQYLIDICNYTAESKKFMSRIIPVSPAQFRELKVGEWYMPVVESQ